MLPINSLSYLFSFAWQKDLPSTSLSPDFLRLHACSHWGNASATLCFLIIIFSFLFLFFETRSHSVAIFPPKTIDNLPNLAPNYLLLLGGRFVCVFMYMCTGACSAKWACLQKHMQRPASGVFLSCSSLIFLMRQDYL